MRKRRTAIAIYIGILASMVVAAPLWGAIASAFWSAGADSNEVRRVSGLLYDETRLDPGGAALMGHMQEYRCGKDVARSLSAGDVTLISALDQHYRGNLDNRYNNLAIDAIASLPAPILGAIQGCINGSPAAPLCLSYLREIAIKATAVPKATEKAWLAEADREIAAAWCAADPANDG